MSTFSKLVALSFSMFWIGGTASFAQEQPLSRASNQIAPYIEKSPFRPADAPAAGTTSSETTSIQTNTTETVPGVPAGEAIAPATATPTTAASPVSLDAQPALTLPAYPEIDARLITTPPCRNWIDPDVKQTAVVLCIHGLGLNADAFNDFGTRMSRRGSAVYAIDVRGFGSWQRIKNGKVLNFDGTINDIKAVLAALRAKHPGLPLFLLGESMGGAIVLRAASQYPDSLDGVISSVPSGRRYKADGTDLKVGVELLTGARKQFDVGTGIVDQATKNTRLREIWESSPLNRMDLSADELLQFQTFMDGNHDAAIKISSLPVLMLQGSLDRLVKAQGTWEIYNDLGTKNRTFIELPSEHLVIEYGRVKTNTYDSNMAQFISTWISSNAPAQLASPVSSQDSLATLPTLPTQNKVTQTDNAADSGKTATVLIFTAPWCAQCDNIDLLVAQAQRTFGNQVTFKKIETDTASNAQLIRQHAVSVIPTFVFQKNDGTTSATIMGNTGFPNISGAIYASLQ